MASEIEIVAEGGTPRGNRNVEAATAAPPQAQEDQRKDDVYTAAAYGDVENLRRLVEEKGCSVSEPDAGGYFALQWSALNNRTAAAEYLLEVGFFPTSRPRELEPSLRHFFFFLVAFLSKFLPSFHAVFFPLNHLISQQPSSFALMDRHLRLEGLKWRLLALHPLLEGHETRN